MPRICPQCGRHFENNEERCPDDGSPTFVVRKEEDLIGKTLDGRFTIKELLGLGGMGAVYRAYQHSMDRDVALKVMRADLARDEQAVRRFFREARAASRLSNPHTITVYDFGQTADGILFIAMELLKGRSLAKELRAIGGPMPWERAVRIVDQVLDSLDEAHAAGIIHRDLKPDNIFLLNTRSGEDFVKVLDFGIAKMREVGEQSLTAAGMAFGTPTYMSPEQAQAKPLDGRSDLYSVGVILFEMLAGKPPFEAETPLALALKKVQEKPPTIYHVNPEVRIPEGLEGLLARLLDADVENRPKTAAEVRALLAKVSADEASVPMPAVVVKNRTTQVLTVGEERGPESIAPTPYGQVPAVKARRGPKLAFLGLAGLMGVVVAATFWLFFLSRSPEEVAGREEQQRSLVTSADSDTGSMVYGLSTKDAVTQSEVLVKAEGDTVSQATLEPQERVEGKATLREPQPRTVEPKVKMEKARDFGVERLLKPGSKEVVPDTIKLKGVR